MNKEEIMTALKALAEKLGRTPLYYEFRTEAKVSEKRISRTFGNYTQAIRACGLPLPGNAKRTMAELFEAWAMAVRALRKTPNVYEFEGHSEINSRGLRKRWGRWSEVRQAMITYATEQEKWADWPDVLEILKDERQRVEADGPLHVPGAGGSHIMDATAPANRIYGEPVWAPAMCHAPTNEAGVLFAFGMMAAELGYMIMKVQTAFPDCEALRRLPDGRWKLERAELEFESGNFLDHGHDPAGCDMIVCWRHNWPECPLPVLELSKVIGKKPAVTSATSQAKTSITAD